MSYQVIYLTGAPAAGKSTLTRNLALLVKPLHIWAFGERLRAHLKKATGAENTYDELRTRSADIVTPADVAAVDKELIDFVQSNRANSHVLIDSHPVTKERYGYRVTPYTVDEFRTLAPTQIWVLYTDSATAVERIGAGAGGRAQVSAEQALFHTHLQASVAIGYGMGIGVPVHFFDTTGNASQLAANLAQRFQKSA